MKVPETSREAYAVTRKMAIDHKAKILKAFQVLGEGSAEGIAVYLRMEHQQVNRRFSEMAKMGLIENTLRKVKTVSGCSAYVWRLKGATAKTQKEINEIERSLKGDAVVDFSKKMSKIKNSINVNQLSIL